MFGAGTGTVTEFEEHRGTGVISGADGIDYAFHCTEIADGRRIIAIGTKVRFEVVAGIGGRTEARSIYRDET